MADLVIPSLEGLSPPAQPVPPGTTKFFLLGDVDDFMLERFVEPFSRAIDEQRNLRNGKLTLYVQGPGGYFSAFSTILSMVHVAQAAGILVRTVALGEVASASSMIAIAGSPGERYIARTAEHMLHYGWGASDATSPIEAERAANRLRRHFATIKAHYMAYAAIPDLDKYLRDDQFWLPAKQCIRYKLADKYLETIDQ